MGKKISQEALFFDFKYYSQKITEYLDSKKEEQKAMNISNPKPSRRTRVKNRKVDNCIHTDR